MRIMPNRKNPERVAMGLTKNANTIAQDEKYADPLVQGVALGRSNNLFVPKRRLAVILKKYKVDHEPGIKTLGNSKVEVEIDNNLNGKLRRRK